MADYTYKAKVGQRWLRGSSLVDTEKDADTFESKTEPEQRVNQMKKDGKVSKSANVEIVKESGKMNYAHILNEYVDCFGFDHGLGSEPISDELNLGYDVYDDEDPWNRGYTDYFQGVSKEDNPYEAGTGAYEMWQSGYSAGENSDDREEPPFLENSKLNYEAILQETRSMTQDLYDYVADSWIYDDELQEAKDSTELADIIKSRIESGWGPEVTDRIIKKVAGFLWEDFFSGKE